MKKSRERKGAKAANKVIDISSYDIPDLPRYTPELNAALDDLIKVFSVMPCPPPEHFLYRERYNRFGEHRPADAKTIAAFDILSKRKPGEPVITADNIASTDPLMFYCEIDVKVWLMPQMLLAIRNWWNIRLEEDAERATKVRHASDAIPMLLTPRVADLKKASFFTKGVSYVFCDTFKNERSDEPDQGAASHRRRLEQAELFKQYMTKDMRHAMKRYLTLWYDVMGTQYNVRSIGNVLSRQWVHNCWL